MIVNIPFSEYLELDRASSHFIWTLLSKSPMHAMAARHAPRKSTPQQQLGTDFHAIAEDPSYVPKKKENLNTIRRMRDSLMEKPIARVLFEGAKFEQTILQTDPETGVKLKARPDALPDGHVLIVDIKTARDASYEAFSRSCATYGYPMQVGLYRHAYELETGSKPAFFFAVVETSDPYDSIIYEASERMLDYGERLMRRGLEIYAECKRSQFWPGRDWDWNLREHGIQSIDLPKWVK